MSQPVGSPRPVALPTRTEPRPSTPSTTPARAHDRPDTRGTGAGDGARDGAAGVDTTPRPTRTSSGRPTKPSPSAPSAAPAIELRRDGRPARPEVLELQELAAATKDGELLVRDDRRAWDPEEDDLTTARNAHHSNTPEEMREALEGNNNWLEGDLRVRDDGELVMAHDADREGDGLTLREWLAIGGTGERGMKVDVKESEAIPELLDALESSGIPDGRLMINVGTSQVSVAGARRMRERFPDAWLAINPAAPEGNGGYSDDALEAATEMADAVGGRVAFPIRWDIASDEAIQQLKPHGKVSIWTATSEGTPDDAAAERQRLLDRGVDGVIDLGPPQGFWDNLAERGKDLWNSGPVRGARDLAGDTGGWLADRGGDIRDGADWLRDRGGDLLGGARDLGGDLVNVGGDLVSGAGDLLDDAPLVGGLFGD